jgi:3',5'-cyclic AMP phosphodiesterase CpdA
MRFIVVADSHIRFPDDDVATYPSNALLVDRNRRVVELCNSIGGEFVVHLGDIVHPLPVEEKHEPAVQLAAGVYAELQSTIYFVPGNHDIGDKPDAMVAVPAVAEENYEVYERYWGRPYGSFDHGDVHLVVVDTPVLNSGLEREARQRSWLEQDLAEASKRRQRIFVFTHYPPFVREPGETEHYDNLGEPARSWFLDLLVRHRVEAVFSGHVHNFLYNHHAGTELYVLPATGFVRPDYSEMAPVEPALEGGRNDTGKLGFFVVDADEGGHRVYPVRTMGGTDIGSGLPPEVATAVTAGWRSPIGVTLRHGWMPMVEFPTAGLDEFRRKRVRNDALLPALWEARISAVRVPIEDVFDAAARQRMRHLAGRGMTFTVRSVGSPDSDTIRLLQDIADTIVRWEVVAWPHDFATIIGRLQAMPPDLSVALSPLVPIGDREASVHHFVSSGFSPNDGVDIAEVDRLDPTGRVAELVFRSSGSDTVADDMAAVSRAAAAMGRRAVLNVELPRAGENESFTDDVAVADLVAAAVSASAENPDVVVFLDGFVDHDRGYYPHHGLIDRRYNPRPALQRLIVEAARLSPG